MRSRLFSVNLGHGFEAIVHRAVVAKLPSVLHRTDHFAGWQLDDDDGVAVAGVSFEFVGVPAGFGAASCVKTRSRDFLPPRWGLESF
jgi:hypothetical protein